MPLGGRPMVDWSMDAFLACEAVGAIVVACPPGESNGFDAKAHEGLEGRPIQIVDGGATRAESVSNALALVATELVAIHDAARPLLTPELVAGVVETLLADPEAAGAIAATPIIDTVKEAAAAVETGDVGAPSQRAMHFNAYRHRNASLVVSATLERQLLWAAQTPQVFRTEALRQALAAAEPEAIAAATDEAMLIEAAGGKVLVHPSAPENLKVTTPLDLKLAELLLAERAG